jgi:hypothetical protein
MLLQQGDKAIITEERIQKWNKLGFEWSIDDWSPRFKELEAFHKENGHRRVLGGMTTKVSDKYHLALWVSH